MPDVLMPEPHLADAPFAGRLEGLYRGHHARMLTVATAITGDPELGREAVQDAFAGMLAGSGPRQADRLEPWAWKCVVNSARQVRRGQRRRGRHVGPDDGMEAVAREVDSPDALVRAAVAALPERQRTVLFLRYYADLDYPTIARTLGIRTGTVSAALHAAHATLRRTLEGRR
ncbi:MAG: sigma-70 family RNA polymerase sigma factor [Thermoleophilia bacterium]